MSGHPRAGPRWRNAILEDSPVAILPHVNEQKILHKYVTGFQMIPVGLINMHSVRLDEA